MFREKESKWTRPRSFWEVNGGDMLMLATALFFLVLSIIGVAVFLFQPRIQGLQALFSDPVPTPPANQKLHLAPGEQEIQLFRKPAPARPAEPGK